MPPRWLLLSLLVGGCNAAAPDAAVRDLRARLDASERSRLELGKKVEDLENRVFLLTDQVESQKVEMARREPPPRLPIVTLRPAAPPVDEPSDGGQSDAPAAADIGAPTTIAEAPRPVIHVEGVPGQRVDGRSHSRTRPGHAPPTTPPLAAAPSEGAVSTGELPNLGVMKLPDRGIPIARDAGTTAGLTIAPSVATTARVTDEEHTPPPAEPLQLYRAAQEQLKQGHLDEAASQFAEFVRRYPRHDYADNAQYWLAETYYARKEYGQAAPEFRTVVRRWPTGNKAPDALLKLGYCLLGQGETDEGRGVLGQLLREYPRTEAAQLAERRLAELPRAEVNR